METNKFIEARRLHDDIERLLLGIDIINEHLDTIINEHHDTKRVGIQIRDCGTTDMPLCFEITGTEKYRFLLDVRKGMILRLNNQEDIFKKL